MLVNALRAHMAEFGIIAPQGLRNVETIDRRHSDDEHGLPELARSILLLVVDQLNDTTARVRDIEARLAKWHRGTRSASLLATVPGVGIMGASAIAATVTDPSLFRSGREFAAWLGMTPRQNSSGGKERLGGASKRGDKYIRSSVGRRRGRRSSPCPRSSDERRGMGARDAGAKAGQGRRGRARQQDRPHRLGGDEARRRLPRKDVIGQAAYRAASPHRMRG